MTRKVDPKATQEYYAQSRKVTNTWRERSQSQGQFRR